MKPEELLSRQIAQFCHSWLPDNVYWNIHPAGGGGAKRGARLKGMGLKAGFPDVIIIYAGRFYGVELKAGKGRLSPVQVATHGQIIAAGGIVSVARSGDEFAALLRYWGIPLWHHPLRDPIDDALPDMLRAPGHAGSVRFAREFGERKP